MDWRALSLRMLVDTWAFSKRLGLWLSLFCIGVGSTVHIWQSGWHAAVSEVQLWVFYTVVPIAGLLLLVMLVNAWLAPYRLMHERLDKAIADGALPSAHPITPLVPADIAHLNGTSTFKLGDAACLWVGLRPHDPIADPRAVATFTRLSGAVMEGRLPGSRGLAYMLSAVSGHPMWPSYEHPVSALDLRRYADRDGNVPPFLQSVSLPDDSAARTE